MAIFRRISQLYSLIKQNAATTHCSCSKSPLTIAQRRRQTQIQEEQFFTDIFDYLGHVLCQGRLELTSHTTDATSGLQLPTDLTELRLLPGLCNIFKQIVFNFAQIVASLN